MKLIAPLLTLLFLSNPAFAQRGGGPVAPIPCKLRIDPFFSKWDESTLEAVSEMIARTQPLAPHVAIGIAFPRSGSNIRWNIVLNETAYTYSPEKGHQVRVEISYRTRDESESSWAAYTETSQVSYLDAVKKILSGFEPSPIEAQAVQMGCPLVAEPAPSRDPSSVAPAAVTPIRAMTANISSGGKQSYDNGEGIRIFQGLKPDVVMIQEFNYKSNSEKDLSEMILTAFSDAFSFYRESESTDQIPNGIISRFPILKSGEWSDRSMPNRDFAWAQMDLPGDRELWAISVHLHSKDVIKRKNESADLVALIKALPEKDYVLLGGDFNIAKRDDNVIQTLAEVVSERAAPTDSKGRTTTNMNNAKNYDWILNDAELAPYQVPVKFKAAAEEAEVELENVYPNGLVFDSTTFPRLDRVQPILPTDSRAQGMQHLAVVKDYAVPAPAPAVVKPAPVDTVAPARVDSSVSTHSTPKSKKRPAKRRWLFH